MDNRILIAGGVTVALLAGAGMLLATGMGSTEAVEPTHVAKPGPGATATPKPRPGQADDEEPAAAPRQPGEKMRPTEVVHDEEYEARAKAARDRRIAINDEWRAETTAAAQLWIASSGLDEAKGAQVMGVFSRTHDGIAQSRLDFEDGVIDRNTFREELAGAKSDLRVELDNVLEPEQKEALLEALTAGKLGGI